MQKKVAKILVYQKFALPLQSFSADAKNRSEPRAAERSMEEIPENIERVTIDKDKKVQELKK